MHDEYDDAKKWQYKANTIYEITIAPNNRYQGFTNKQSIMRFKHWRQCMVKNLRQYLDDVAVYYLVPEVSMPQSSHKDKFPRLHLHGILQFRNEESVMRFLIDNFKSLSEIGILQFNKYRYDEWDCYITKDTEYMKKYCELVGTNYQISNVMEYDDVKHYSTS